MVDSGAGTNGAKCKTLFPDYKIQDYLANRPGPRCVAANSAPLENGGYENLNVVIDGEDRGLPMMTFHSRCRSSACAILRDIP